MVATGCIAATAAQIDPLYSPGGADVHADLSIYGTLGPSTRVYTVYRHTCGSAVFARLAVVTTKKHTDRQSTSVMNAAARLVCSARKSDHITPQVRDLHWLRVPQRIEFKLAVLVFRCLHGIAPLHLARELYSCVADMDCRRRLRFASTLELHVPPTCRVTVGDRAFAVSATPRVWNALPSDVITSPSLIAFQRRLNTLLFSRSFDL